MAQSRSPNYPGVSLPEAVELVTKLYQREARSPMDAERAALALGYRSLSGKARTKLSALRKFDLVDDTPAGIRVSDLAMAVLHPTNPDERRDALRAAATTPSLFRSLAEYPGASDENLTSRLVRMGFTEAGAKLAVASFRKTMSLVPDGASEYDESDDEIEDAVTPDTQAPIPGRSNVRTRTNRGGTVLYVPLPSGTRAELQLPAETSLADLEAIVQWVRTAPEGTEATDESGESLTADPDASGRLLLSGQSPDDAQESAS